MAFASLRVRIMAVAPLSTEAFRESASKAREAFYARLAAPQTPRPPADANRLGAALQRYRTIILPQRQAACRACDKFDGACRLLRRNGRTCDQLYCRILWDGGAHPSPECPWNDL